MCLTSLHNINLIELFKAALHTKTRPSERYHAQQQEITRLIYGGPWLESEAIATQKKMESEADFSQDCSEIATSPYIKSGIPWNSRVEE